MRWHPVRPRLVWRVPATDFVLCGAPRDYLRAQLGCAWWRTLPPPRRLPAGPDGLWRYERPPLVDVDQLADLAEYGLRVWPPGSLVLYRA